MRMRTILAFTVLILTVASWDGLARASVPITTIVTFAPAAGEFPEGVAVDKVGNIYVSLINPAGEVVKFTPDGTRSVLAHFPAPAFGPLGLATDATGNVYVCDATFDPSTAGIYRVTPDGTATRLDGTGPMVFPNAVALDKRGNVYATDSATGSIWKIPPGGTAVIWLQDELLEGTGAFGLGFAIGANGVAFRKGDLIAANTEVGSLVRIPVRSDGSPGAPSVIAEGPELFGADGIAVGVFGNVFVAVNPQSMLVKVAPDGSTTTLATAADGLENPASLAFGTRSDRQSLYVTNFAVFTTPPHPALLKANVGEAGVPLP